MKQLDIGDRMQLDHSAKGFTYFENAVDRHWNPKEIDLSKDGDRILEMVEEYDEAALERLLGTLRGFGIGEEAVTEDLAPFADALEDINDQMFITTQLYEEAKHAQFFDRYWREVIHPVEDELGRERSYPRDWDDDEYKESYEELFERNERALDRLLEENTPENQAKAYCHYHLVIEGIAAQTGYFNVHSLHGSDRVPEIPNLPGLSEGFANIRADEGRHVGFGMAKLKQLVESGQVSAELIQDTVDEILPLVKDITAQQDPELEHLPGIPEEEVEEYAASKHLERMEQIVDASQEIPHVDELVRVETAGD